MSLPPSPSPGADEKLIEFITGLRDALLAARRRNDQHVAAYDEVAHRIETLFDAIKHGDDEHQQWLRDAITAHFDGRCVPAPTAATGEYPSAAPESEGKG